jgi:sorbitol-specific phosphotransferase system component IIBC
MRSILIGMLVAVGLTFVGTAPTLAAPASSAVISQAAAEMSPVTQAACTCLKRGHTMGSCAVWSRGCRR